MTGMETATIELTGALVEPAQVVAVARHGAPARLSDAARDAMAESADAVARLAASERPIYGVSTGFGSLAGTWIPSERREELQRSLIRSHAAGMGPPVEREVVRAMMFLRARSLAMGRSGARPIVAETMLALLAAGLDPVVPEHGSLGASGDLAPLAHCGLALIGEGELWTPEGERVPAAEGLAAASIEPITLTAKEGLALINGTDGILGMLLLALHDLERLLKVADVTAAMSTEALLGTDRAFAADLIEMRPQPGQQRSAANLTRLLAGSAIVASHRYDDPRVQDAYSLRCAPQVNGATRDTCAYARERGRRGAECDDRQPGGDARRARGVVRELPRRTRGAGLRLPGYRRRRAGRDRRAPHGPHARPEPLVRAAAVPRRGRRGQLRADARPLHPGRDGRREPPAVRAREHRLAAHERDAGGPRVDGLGRGPQAPHRARERGPHPGGGAHLRGAGARPARPARAGARHGRGTSLRAGGSCPAPGRTAGSRRSSAAVEELVASNALLEAVESAIGSLE